MRSPIDPLSSIELNERRSEMIGKVGHDGLLWLKCKYSVPCWLTTEGASKVQQEQWDGMMRLKSSKAHSMIQSLVLPDIVFIGLQWLGACVERQLIISWLWLCPFGLRDFWKRAVDWTRTYTFTDYWKSGRQRLWRALVVCTVGPGAAIEIISVRVVCSVAKWIIIN